jgi:hypothetical protein
MVKRERVSRVKNNLLRKATSENESKSAPDD